MGLGRLISCTFGTPIASIRRPVSVLCWLERSGVPGWCTTTPWKAARSGGLPYPGSGDPPRLVITWAKRTSERAWLASVGVFPLIRSLRDLDTAYTRTSSTRCPANDGGSPVGPPMFKSRKDSSGVTSVHPRQVPRPERCRAEPGQDRRRECEMVTRFCPPTPSSVTVVLDMAGRYHASYVADVETKPPPKVLAEVGTDLDLTTHASRTAA